MSQLTQKQEEQRDLCLQYFEEMNLTKGKAAIIDLNGSRRSHKAINKILSLKKYPPVFGYYFSLVPDRIAGNDYLTLNYGERFDISRYTYRMLHTLVFEEYFSMSNHESTVSYEKIEGHVRPVFEGGIIPHSIRERVFNIHCEVCCKYAEFYAKYIDVQKSDEICRSVYGAISDFFDAPEKDLLSILSGIRFSFTSKVHMNLVGSKPFLKLLLRKEDGMWFSGNLVYNSPFPKMTTMALRFLRGIRIFRQQWT